MPTRHWRHAAGVLMAYEAELIHISGELSTGCQPLRGNTALDGRCGTVRYSRLVAVKGQCCARNCQPVPVLPRMILT